MPFEEGSYSPERQGTEYGQADEEMGWHGQISADRWSWLPTFARLYESIC